MVGRYSTFFATILGGIVLGCSVLSSNVFAQPGLLVNDRFGNLFIHDLAPTEPDDQNSSPDNASPVLDRMETALSEAVDGIATKKEIADRLNNFFRRHVSALSEKTLAFIEDNTQGIDIVEVPLTRSTKQLASLMQTIETGEYGSALPEEFGGPQGFSLLRLMNYYSCVGAIIAAIKNDNVVINLKEKPVTFTLNGKPYQTNQVVVLDGIVCEDPLYGKINSRSWKYDKSSGSGGFDLNGMIINRYTPVIKGGSLYFKSLPGSVYDWRIRVEEAYVESILSIGPRRYDGTDPFIPVVAGTELPPLPKQMFDTDPRNPDSVWSRGLTHRLYANGKGIKIIRVRERGVGLLDDEHPWLQESENSCIDILFKDYFPTDFSDFPTEQEGWCLGRCKKPMIANSR